MQNEAAALRATPENIACVRATKSLAAERKWRT